MKTDTIESMLKRGARSSPISVICAIGFLFFTFWGYYFTGLRVLDFTALFGIFLGLFFCSRTDDSIIISDNTLRQPIPLALIVIGYAVIGLIVDSENTKTAIGFMIGTIVFFIYYVMPIDKNILNILLSLTIILHVMSLVVQLILYYASGVLINFHAIIGVEPRLMSAIFRPAGFFQEPAHYALNMLLLLLIRGRTTRFVRSGVDTIGLLSIPLTISLWGIVATLLYAAVNRPKIFIMLLLILLFAGGFITVVFGFEQFPALLHVQNRLSDLGSDGSAQARYRGAGDALESWTSSSVLWFGRGINSDYVDLGGANGFSFLLNSFGILGSALLGLAYVTTVQLSNMMKLFVFVFFILTAAPIWTFMMFWAWLALMARPFDPPSGVYGRSNAGPVC